MKKILLILTAFIFTAACGTTAMYFTVKRPAQINLKGYKKIAIGHFSGANPRHVNSVVNLTAEKLLETKYFEAVMDRKYIDDLVKEHKLQLSGMFDEKNIVRLGEFIGAASIIYATIDTDSYREDFSSETKIKTVSNRVSAPSGKKGEYTYKISVETNVHNTRVLVYSLVISFQIVDVATARLITAQTMKTERRFVKTAVNGKPDPIIPDDAFLTSAQELCSRFVTLLVPSYVTVQANFQVDGKLPEVETAVKKMQNGFMDEGIAILAPLTNRPGLAPEIQAKTFYNLGLALSFNGQYDDALVYLKRAGDINPREGLYDQAIRMVVNERENSLKLKEQE